MRLSYVELNGKYEYKYEHMIKISASNYLIWKPMMKDVLYCKDLHDPIKGDNAKPSEMSDKDWEKLNRKTIDVLDNALM